MTITEAARRAQIIEATIETIADHGFASATYARIAKRAGLSSTGLISYHFAGKDDLILAVMQHVVGQIGAHMHDRVQRAASPGAALETYISGVIAFIRDHPRPMRALLEIVLGGALPPGPDALASGEAAIAGVEGILRWGQETGDFRTFDVRVMATTIQRAIEAIPFALVHDPALDLDLWAAELVRTFTLATERHA